MDIHPNLDNLIITGGFDSNAIIYDRLKSQVNFYFINKSNSKDLIFF